MVETLRNCEHAPENSQNYPKFMNFNTGSNLAFVVEGKKRDRFPEIDDVRFDDFHQDKIFFCDNLVMLILFVQGFWSFFLIFFFRFVDFCFQPLEGGFYRGWPFFIFVVFFLPKPFVNNI